MNQCQRESYVTVKRLRCGLAFHAYCYYVLDDPVVSDEKYDKWYRELETLEKESPNLDSPHSPTKHVDRGICDQHLQVCDRCHEQMWIRVQKDWKKSPA